MSKESFDESILRVLNDLNAPALAEKRQRLMKDLNKKRGTVSLGFDQTTGQEISINLD